MECPPRRSIRRLNAIQRGFRTISCFSSVLPRRLRWSQTVTTSANSNSPGHCPLPLPNTAGLLALALANVLASAQAAEMGIYVVRAFVQLRQLFEALRELTSPPEPTKLPIGFVTAQHKPTHKASKAVKGKMAPYAHTVSASNSR